MCEDCSYGSVSSMPGSTHAACGKCMCASHQDRVAVARVQGETDSMGCEYIHVCAECLEEFKGAARTHRGICALCKTEAEVKHWRDPDEGQSGPVYEVCQPCRRQANAQYEDDDTGDDSFIETDFPLFIGRDMEDDDHIGC